MKTAESIRAQVALLMTIVTIVAIASTAVTVYLLYNTAINVEKERLADIVEKQIYIINTLSTQEHSSKDEADMQGVMASQALESLVQGGDSRLNASFAETGEVVVGHRSGDVIEYFCTDQPISSDNSTPLVTRITPWNSQLSTPLRKALVGETGTSIELDYMGKTVLASYAPVPDSDWGVVAKLDLSEVQKPFARAALFSGLAAILIVILGYFLFRIISNPFLDIKKTEDEFTAQNKTMSGILDNVADGIISMAEDGTIISFNRSAEKMFRYSASEIIGKNIAVLMTSFDAGKHDSYVRGYVKTETPKIIGIGPREVNGVRKDGSSIPIDLAVNVVHSDGKRIFVGSVRDISERIVRRMRLQRSQKIEAIGQLTGGVAHDFKNILRNIQENLDQLEDKCDGDETSQEYIRNATRASKHGIEMVQRLLAFSRRQKITSESIDIQELVSDVVKLAGPSLGQDIKVDVNIARDLWSVVTDKGQLENALLSLFLNSKDAMPDGGDLTIKAENMVLDTGKAKKYGIMPGEYICMDVIDNGCGMTKDDLDKVFQPFFTTKDFGKGSGLGLSIIHGFVTQTGGAIVLASQLSKGTDVQILLPRHGQSSPL